MEFGFEPVCDQVRDSSNLVADRFAAGLNQIPLCYPGLYSGLLKVCDQLRTCLRPDSIMEFGLKLCNIVVTVRTSHTKRALTTLCQIPYGMADVCTLPRAFWFNGMLANA